MTLLVKKSFTPNFVDSFFNNDWFSDSVLESNNSLRPAVNVVETNDNYRIEVAAPGHNKEDFHVDVENHVLTISSKRENVIENENDEYVRREFEYCSFERSFSLPELVKEESIKASYKDGILHVNIPKKEEAKLPPAREIKIS